MPDTALISKLPLADSFAAVYLEQWGILPLELQGNRLVVAVAGVPDAEVMDDRASQSCCHRWTDDGRWENRAHSTGTDPDS